MSDKNTNNTSFILEAKELSKTYTVPCQVKILDQVSFCLPKGRTVSIMGASGEGKSTLLHILGTLDTCDSGSLYIDGEKVTPSGCCRIRNQKIGFIFQSFHLLEDYTALENVLMPAQIGRDDTSLKSKSYQRACELLDFVGLNHRKDFHSKLLSGGERQRVAIARAFCNHPELILADEPTGNLDFQTSLRVQQILFELSKGEGKSLIIVTHDPELAKLCDETYLLKEGKLEPINFS